MIRITLYKNKNGLFTGFKTEGHAGYAENGKDIVCAAVSALGTTVINSADENLGIDGTRCSLEVRDGFIDYRITSEPDDMTELLFRTFLVGVRDVAKSYGQYVRYVIKEEKDD